MRVYRIMIQGDRYPTEYSVQASNIATACARGIREWHERFKGKKLPDELKIKIIRGGILLKETDK
jgi:hypothetical protein